eukprot:Gb_41828 [translate_table: standard]
MAYQCGMLREPWKILQGQSSLGIDNDSCLSNISFSSLLRKGTICRVAVASIGIPVDHYPGNCAEVSPLLNVVEGTWLNDSVTPRHPFDNRIIKAWTRKPAGCRLSFVSCLQYPFLKML